jgi:hypothetical protein
MFAGPSRMFFGLDPSFCADRDDFELTSVPCRLAQVIFCPSHLLPKSSFAQVIFCPYHLANVIVILSSGESIALLAANEL